MVWPTLGSRTAKEQKRIEQLQQLVSRGYSAKAGQGLHGPDPQTRPAFHKFDEEVLMWWISLSRLLLSGARFSKLLKIFLSSS